MMRTKVNFIENVSRYIRENNMIENEDRVIAGLSGGADSVCLVLVLNELKERLGFTLEAVHVNHGIRGEEALRDELFVKNLCQSLGIKLTVVHSDVPGEAKRLRMSCEEAGRYVRRETFAKMCSEYSGSGRALTALAHHMDDQAETVLHNLVRGSALRGLAGIAPVSAIGGYAVIRPLLCVRRSQIEEYLALRGQDYCTDSTNLQNDYTRNRLRNAVIPMLEDTVNSNAVKNIAAAAEFAAAAGEYIQRQADEAYNSCVQDEKDVRHADADDKEQGSAGRKVVLDAAKLAGCAPLIRGYVVHMAIAKAAGAAKDICAVHVNEVLALIDGQTGSSADIPYSLTARRGYDTIIIGRAADAGTHAGMWYGQGGWYKISGAVGNALETGIIDEKNLNLIKENDYTKLIDYDKIKSGLQLRTRQENDRICIYGDGRSKKLSRFMTDIKVPAEYGNRVLVAADGSDIVWVVGFRVSEAYKAGASACRTGYIRIAAEREDCNGEDSGAD